MLSFWFEHTQPRQWFSKDPVFDQRLQHRFLGLTRQAAAGELAAWGEEPESVLALVLLLDQFPRQIWRDGVPIVAEGDSLVFADGTKRDIVRSWPGCVMVGAFPVMMTSCHWAAVVVGSDAEPPGPRQ